jgi:hypothetical protein
MAPLYSMGLRKIDIISEQLLSAYEVRQTLPSFSLNHLVHLQSQVACNIPLVAILCSTNEIDFKEQISIAKLLFFRGIRPSLKTRVSSCLSNTNEDIKQ